MFIDIFLSYVAFISVFEYVFSQNQNETTPVKGGDIIVDPSDTFSRNISANISVLDNDLIEKSIDKNNVSLDMLVQPEPISRTDKFDNTVKLNTLNTTSLEPKKLDNFRPSPQLETYYEFNKTPVKPAIGEPKINYGQIEGKTNNVLIPPEKGKSRTLYNPGYPTFGNTNLQLRPPTAPNYINTKNSAVWGDEINRNLKERGYQTHSNKRNEFISSDTPWVTRVRFPTTSVSDRPYSFVTNPGIDQSTLYNSQNGYSYEKNVNNKNQPLPGSDGGSDFLPGSIINDKGYLPPSYGSGGGSFENKNRYLPPNGFSSSGQGEGFNFNKPVEVPNNKYLPTGNRVFPDQKTYDYNLMEKPYSEGLEHHKTYHEGVSHAEYGSPWKKILKLFATFIPIGLLISALTPTVITVTNVNDTTMQSTRYRSSEDPKTQLTNHILSSLDYFEKLNENGCEYRVFCELLVSASHMPNSQQHVANLLDNFSKQEIDIKSRAEELKKVFQAVRNKDCHPIQCEFIKKPK